MRTSYMGTSYTGTSYMGAYRGGSIRPYFEALLLLLLATGFLTLVGTGRLGWIWVSLGTIALGLRGIMLARGAHFILPSRWVNFATLLYILFFAADMMLLGSSFIFASTHLVLFAAIVKLFSAERPRDYLYLCILAFLEVLAATTLTVAAGFLVFFAIFLLLLVATFVAYEMYRGEQASAGRRRVDHHFSTRRVRRGLAGISLGMALAIGVLGASLFFLLPRLSFQYWNPLLARTGITGFSNDVHLGEVQDLQRSNQVVMHIRLLGPEARTPALLARARRILWRGRALNQFNGDRWLDTMRPTVANTSFGRLTLPPLLYPDKPMELLQYRVMMEPLGAGVLFLAPGLRVLMTPLPDLVVDAGLTVTPMAMSSLGTGTGGLVYTAVSDLGEPPASLLRHAGRQYPYNFQQRYLQLPYGLDPRIARLAHGIVAHAPADAWDRMQALKGYLRSHYRYTIQGLPGGRDPLANFLFRRRAGDCEYFASALAILGRTLGIPTRVVNGFVTGPYNQFSHEFLIRGRDAHAWVEAYFPPPVGSAYAAAGGPGMWIPLDATPASAVPAFHGPWARAQLLLDAAQTFWQDWIINYDFSHQVRLALDMRRNWVHQRHDLLASFRQKAAGWRRSLEKLWRQPAAGSLEMWRLLLGLLALAGAAVYARRLFARGFGGWRGTGGQEWERRRATEYYRQLQQTLRRAGYQRPAALTAPELALQVKEPHLRPAIVEFLQVYEAVRFGDQMEGLAAMPRQLRTIRRLMQSTPEPARQ